MRTPPAPPAVSETTRGVASRSGGFPSGGSAAGESAADRLDRLETLAAACDGDGHVRRVGRIAAILAGELGYPPADAARVGRAAGLHDVGKAGLPAGVIGKPGPLSPGERSLVRRHTLRGALLASPDGVLPVRDARDDDARAVLTFAARIALGHHERWDGMGYPYGLAGAAIPLVGRVTAVADVFDALRGARPYKPAFPLPRCLSLLHGGRGTQFDPDVLDAFHRRLGDVLAGGAVREAA